MGTSWAFCAGEDPNCRPVDGIRAEDGIGAAVEAVHTAFTSGRHSPVMSMVVQDA